MSFFPKSRPTRRSFEESDIKRVAFFEIPITQNTYARLQIRTIFFLTPALRPVSE